MNKTKIEWCDSTWNPVTGCLHDCEYCYAKKIANRFGGWFYTPGMLAMNIAEDKTYIAPIKKYYGEAKETEYGKIADITAVSPFLKRNGSKAPYPFGFIPTFHRYRLREPQKWTKPRTIFVCSMADLFGEWVPDEWIEEVFEACKRAPQHTYLFLTKNSKRYVDLYQKGKLPLDPNMWYGISVTNCEQAEQAEENIESLPKKTNNFISAEPLLENVAMANGWYFATENKEVKWVIVGAESGIRKDKIVPKKEWVETLVRTCNYNEIPVFMKDSLIPVIGEANMKREFPWEIKM